ncbi:hypothetical protein BHE74_00014274 [Ensete ventricosum]|nr:hypothetical protein GW17_00012299 [Ensete ventricosum]RWW77556.1 hypothetical protein BHE74_00014274 [Ensete ventricosum]
MPYICSRPPFFLEEEEDDDDGGGLRLVSQQSLCVPITLRQCRILFFAQCDKLTKRRIRRTETDSSTRRDSAWGSNVHITCNGGSLPPILNAFCAPDTEDGEEEGSSCCYLYPPTKASSSCIAIYGRGRSSRRRMRLLVVVLVLLFGPHHHGVEAAGGEFIGISGLHFVLNGNPFFANGFNAYWLMTLASDPSQRDKVSSALSDASSYELSVARTWAFSDGGSNALQYSPGSYNEQTFQVSPSLLPSSPCVLERSVLLSYAIAFSWSRGWILWCLRPASMGSGS